MVQVCFSISSSLRGVYPRPTSAISQIRHTHYLFIHLSPTVFAQATKLITETFASGLHHIFAYYITQANLRRSNAVSYEKMKQKDLIRQSGLVETDKEAVDMIISPVKQQNLKYLKGLMNSQKDMISYKEYLQVCRWSFFFVVFRVYSGFCVPSGV